MKNYINKKLQALSLKPQASSGFSLVELIVAVSIIIIITSVSLFHQAKFSSDILISNMAYEVALTIRQAQVFGISSKGNTAATELQSTERYRVGYGVHFSADEEGVKPGSFLTFIDVPTGIASSIGENTSFNYKFDVDNTSGPTDIITSTLDLTQGQKIRKLWVHGPDGWDYWDITSEGTMSLDIVFVKPNPDAHITIGRNGVYTENYDEAKIVIESGLGDKCRIVTVRVTGQVSVDAIVQGAELGGCLIDYSAQ